MKALITKEESRGDDVVSAKVGGGKNPQGADLLYFLIFVFTFLLLAALL